MQATGTTAGRFGGGDGGAGPRLVLDDYVLPAIRDIEQAAPE